METLLREKELEVTKVTQQLAEFKKVARDLTKIVEHSKSQSRVVVELKQQLEQAEVYLHVMFDLLQDATLGAMKAVWICMCEM